MEFEYQESKMTIVTMTIMTTIEANNPHCSILFTVSTLQFNVLIVVSDMPYLLTTK